MLRTTLALAWLGIAAAGVSAFTACGPGDDCSVTLTCAPAAGGSAGAGGSTGQGGGLNQGEPCTDSTECNTAGCVDGVCCDAACDGACEACNVPDAVGTCTPHAAATDPDDDCGGGVCDGSGQCANGDHLWSKSFGGVGADGGIALAIDEQDNVVLLGTANGPVDLGGGPLNTTGPTSFLAKFDVNGAHLWSIAIGDVDAGALVIAEDGVIHLAGGTDGTVACGGETASSSGAYDALLMRFDANGNCVSVDTYGDAADQAILGAAVDGNGDLLVAGRFQGAFGFGPTMTSAGGDDLFIAKLEPTGGLIWQKRFGGTGNDAAAAITTPSTGGAVLIGSFEQTVQLDNTSITSTDAQDAFAIGVDDGGTVTWSERYGGMGSDVGTAVQATSAGDLTLSGSFADTIDLGDGPLTATGMQSVFAGRLDSQRGHLWSHAFHDLVTFGTTFVDLVGRTVVGGFFGGTVDFGSGPHQSAGGSDIALIKLASDGTLLWDQRFGGNEHDQLRAVRTTADGSIVLTGSFISSIGFGGSVLTTGGGTDGFLVKLSP